MRRDHSRRLRALASRLEAPSLAFALLSAGGGGLGSAQSEAWASSPGLSPVLTNDPSSSYLSQSRSEDRFDFGVRAEYLSMSNRGESLSGGGLEAFGLYALSPRWAVGVGMGEALSTSFNSLFTEFEVKAAFQLTGSLIRYSSGIAVEATPVMASESIHRGGWRLEAQVSQYYLTGSVSTLPFTGLGASVIYGFPSVKASNLEVGLRMDTLGNGTTSLTPVRFVVGLEF